MRVIAIDGPAASGKSSVSKGVAAALGYSFVSSGHFYRAVAWWMLELNKKLPGSINFDDPSSVTSAVLCITRINLADEKMMVDWEDATPHLSDSNVVAIVSRIAAIPDVRNVVNEELRNLSLDVNLVMEGRDIGSVVFPETPYKFYLDASPEERARRRAKEGAIDSVAERDRLDSTRATAPLTIPEGAKVIDTTHLNLDQVIQAVLSHLSDEKAEKLKS